jgi:uncharacterized membrane protein
MESFFMLLALAAVLFMLSGLILGLIAISRISRLDRKLAALKAEFEGGSSPRPTPQAPEPVIASVLPVPEIIVPEITESRAPKDKSAKLKPDIEQRLASRWFVWVGGAAIALGGLLFVKYANDQGLIPPLLRVAFGLGAAAALVYAGEYLRKRQAQADYVPAALSAAGLVIAFGAIYAAYALYGILSPAVCFPLLVAVGLGALWLSRRQGPLIAALGLLGAFVAPAIVPSDHPSAWGFFAYLAVLVAAALHELRLRAWWWLGYAAVAGALAWTLLWLGGSLFEPSHTVPTAIFAYALGAAATFIPRGKNILAADHGSLQSPDKMSQPLTLAVAGIAAAAAALAMLVWQSNHANVSLFFFSAGMTLIAGLGWFRHGTSFAALAAAAMTFLVLMSWREVAFHSLAFDERGFWTTVPGFVAPPQFRNWMFAALLAYAGLGMAGMLRKAETTLWATLTSGAAVLFLLGTWARADFVMAESLWALVAAGLGAALIYLAWLHRDKAHQLGTARAVDVLLLAVAGLALFTADRLFDHVSYTIAIAAVAFAFCVSARKLPSQWSGAIASGLASLAAARLFVGREFWGEPQGLLFGAHWVLYGYGVPAILFYQGSRPLDAGKFGRWKTALEGLSLGLAISLISLELRVLIGGGIVRDEPGLLELSAHALAWLGAAFGLAYRQNLYSGFVAKWGARILLAASCAAFGLTLTVLNPLVTQEVIAGTAMFNSLWLAYLAPVPLLALMARKLASLELSHFRNALGIIALVLLLAFVTLQVKRLFQGPVLVADFLSDGESYATSLAWLVTAVALFVVGIKFDRQTIRYGALAILVLTVFKVFVFDLSDLSGLWRIASLMGLGFCLVGIGWLYTTFVQRGAADLSSR